MYEAYVPGSLGHMVVILWVAGMLDCNSLDAVCLRLDLEVQSKSKAKTSCIFGRLLKLASYHFGVHPILFEWRPLEIPKDLCMCQMASRILSAQPSRAVLSLHSSNIEISKMIFLIL